jgi:hypothetical protein
VWWHKSDLSVQQISGALRCFIVAENAKVVGYYALASGAIAVTSSVGVVRRNIRTPYRSSYSAA